MVFFVCCLSVLYMLAVEESYCILQALLTRSIEYLIGWRKEIQALFSVEFYLRGLHTDVFTTICWADSSKITLSLPDNSLNKVIEHSTGSILMIIIDLSVLKHGKMRCNCFFIHYVCCMDKLYGMKE